MSLSLNTVCADMDPLPTFPAPLCVSGGGGSSLSLDEACRGRGHTATVNTRVRADKGFSQLLQCRPQLTCLASSASRRFTRRHLVLLLLDHT